MSEQDLFKEAFDSLNAFKRHRALERVRQKEDRQEDANYHKLNQYFMIDSLELALRALQRHYKYGDHTGTTQAEEESK